MRVRQWVLRGIAAAWFIAGVCALMGVGVMQAKAQLAQWLVARSWEAGVQAGEPLSPWPWSDAKVAARLDMVELSQSSYVFDSDNPSALAFGPGWSVLSSRGQRQTVELGMVGQPMFSDVLVVSAHRDTHFSGLDDLRTGMSLRLSTVAETHGEWRVRRAYVVDSRRGRLGFQVAPGDLLLVTCYPLDAFFPGGPLRWVVHATPAPVAEGTLIQGEQLARLD